MSEDTTPKGLNAEEAEHLAGDSSAGISRQELFDELWAVVERRQLGFSPIEVVGALETVKLVYMRSIGRCDGGK